MYYQTVRRAKVDLQNDLYDVHDKLKLQNSCTTKGLERSVSFWISSSIRYNTHPSETLTLRFQKSKKLVSKKPLYCKAGEVLHEMKQCVLCLIRKNRALLTHLRKQREIAGRLTQVKTVFLCILNMMHLQDVLCQRCFQRFNLFQCFQIEFKRKEGHEK